MGRNESSLPGRTGGLLSSVRREGQGEDFYFGKKILPSVSENQNKKAKRETLQSLRPGSVCRWSSETWLPRNDDLTAEEATLTLVTVGKWNIAELFSRLSPETISRFFLYLKFFEWCLFGFQLNRVCMCVCPWVCVCLMFQKMFQS